jgi:hypothetical protein
MGLAKTVGKKLAEKATEGALASVAKKAPRMSEALNPHIGKRLYITQADRTALDYDQGLLGGPGFVELAGIDPALYADKAWAVQTPGIAKTMVGSMARNPEEAIWTNLIGSPEQHRSNKVVFDRIMNRFEKAIQEDKLTPELHQTINKRLASIKDPKTGKSFFPEDVDILSPEFNQHAQTFHQRAFIADILAGKGVGGKKGSIIDYPQEIKDTTDALLLDAKTGDIGNRLFSLSGNIEHRPELHPAFHTSLGGRKESEAFAPAPQGIVLKNFTKEFTERTGRLPTYYDLTRGYAPSEEVTDEMLERMYKSGYAGGGLAKKFGKKIAERLAKDIELPPAENSARTQIVGTLPTYEKARDILGKEGIKGSDIIDFGAGKGLGSTSMKADSFEPYPQGWYPTYTKSEDIPSEKYKGLLNLNVLNVLDPEMRAHTVKEIGRVMQPEGGTGLITTRGRDVMNTVGGREGPEPMSIITSRDTYQKGFEPNELREYIKYILGGDFEYEPLNLGPAGVKIKKKADGGSIDEPEVLKEIPRGKISGKIADILKPASEFLGKYEVLPQIPLLGGTSVAELTGVEGIQTLADDISRGYRPIRNLERGKLQTSFFDPRLVDAVDLGTTALGGVGLAKNLGKTAIKEGMKQIETGTGMLGRNVMNPRMNIIKDPGGMLVGGERDLDEALLNMKKTENAYPHAQANFVTDQKDPNAVALNSWIDTKVRKYIRNQAGSEADPIRKLVDEGVPYSFSQRGGESKFATARKRKAVDKPTEGISQTPEGKEWEYTVDTIFHPSSSAEVKAILNNPNIDDARKKSMLRLEHDLPIQTDADYEAIKLINDIPDKNVYDLNPAGLTNKLGLNHVSDVLYEDLMSGKLKPEQLNQMSIEKAIRRTAEYDAQKAREMEKANAASAEGMPIPKEYDDGFKWVELKYTEPKDYVPEGYNVSSMTYDNGQTVYFANTPTTRSSSYNTREEAQKELNDTIKGLKSFREKNKTKEALTSEGEIMGHCVGSYCEDVSRGDVKIYSLRGPDGKSHVTIEARPKFNATQWYEANADLINSDPYLKDIEPNVASGDIDAKYGNNPSTDADYVRMMTKEMRRRGIEPIEPAGYMELHQVKGKQNKRPDEKYQSYISDFITNNPTKHEIVEVKELQNTNLMGVQDVADNGLVPKDIHFHPDIEKIVKNYPKEKLMQMYRGANMQPSQTEFNLAVKENIFREAARDFARQGKGYFTKDELLNHLKDKYLPTQKAKGGSIDLQQEYKLENMRRRYG